MTMKKSNVKYKLTKKHKYYKREIKSNKKMEKKDKKKQKSEEVKE